MRWIGSAGVRRSGFDETTGETTSHLTKAASCQVIGYSQSTDETTGHLTKPQKTRQVIGHKHDKAVQAAGYNREWVLDAEGAFAAKAAPTGARRFLWERF